MDKKQFSIGEKRDLWQEKAINSVCCFDLHEQIPEKGPIDFANTDRLKKGLNSKLLIKCSSQMTQIQSLKIIHQLTKGN